MPVVTCPRETFASRQTLSILSTIGVNETVARDLSHYVELGAALSENLPLLAELRATLRARMAKSPLCDGARFAAGFMDALRSAWKRWCESAP